jgi:hypothetical protein
LAAATTTAAKLVYEASLLGEVWGVNGGLDT